MMDADDVCCVFRRCVCVCFFCGRSKFRLKGSLYKTVTRVKTILISNYTYPLACLFVLYSLYLPYRMFMSLINSSSGYYWRTKNHTISRLYRSDAICNGVGPCHSNFLVHPWRAEPLPDSHLNMRDAVMLFRHCLWNCDQHHCRLGTWLYALLIENICSIFLRREQ